MILTFRIEYRTQWGEAIGVTIDGRDGHPVLLSTADGARWEGAVELADIPVGSVVTYRYGVWRNDECVRLEVGTHPHVMQATAQRAACYVLNDAWRDLPVANYLYSYAFSGRHEASGKGRRVTALSSVMLRVLCPCLTQKGQVLAIVGEDKVLGGWDTAKALPFDEVLPNHWTLSIDAAHLPASSEYKLVALNKDTHEVAEWEGGSNRILYVPALQPGTHCLLPEVELYFPSTNIRVAGTAVPVFSLRSEGSQGVGDFGDLRALIDWAVLTNQKAIQILPINDTTITGTWTDSYPYNSISIYAFHPMYADLRQLPPLKDKKAQQDYERKWRVLNDMLSVDYEAVNNLKRGFLRESFKEKGGEVMASAAFKTFYNDNEHWLRPYAVFSYLRDKYGTPEYEKWPELSQYDANAVLQLCQPQAAAYHNIRFYQYVQYVLHVQLLAVSEYARAKGVILKGDIPIGISRASVEAWVEPYYFNLNGQAGAPPDAFSAAGQNWGFPTYNWEVMAQDGYTWWKRRFAKMAEYFSAYRIDHILGFFRIWEIPAHSVQGLLGQFSPALPMSPQEIGSFGLTFQKDFMTRPFINDTLLGRLFGNRRNYVEDTFLVYEHDDIWQLRPEYATQRQVEAWFKAHEAEVPGAQQVRDGLYTLINNVLFVEDHRQAGLYHPRIAVQQDYIYERLSWAERDAFNSLYNHYFYERHNDFWYAEAMKKLPELLQAAPMLACGEDLGMVPHCVPWVMNGLQIMSLEIQRMPKDPHHDFGHVWEYPYRSVCTISTHDMSTLRGWWHEDEAQTARFYHEVLGHGGDVPAEAPGWVCEEVVRRHLESPSLLCILALQDWMSIDESLRLQDADAERINIPANPRHYWRYRMHVTIEELMRRKAFNAHMCQLIAHTGRA